MLLHSFRQLLEVDAATASLPKRKATAQAKAHLGQKSSLKFREIWRYNDLFSLERPNYARPEATLLAPSMPEQAWMQDNIQSQAANPQDLRIVFFNGAYQSNLSSPENKLNTLGIGILNQKTPFPAHAFSSVMGDVLDDKNLLQTLNTSLAEVGVFVRLPAKMKAAKPVHVFYFAIGLERSTALFYKNGLLLGDDSELEVVQHVVSGTSAHLTNVFSHVLLGRGAKLHLTQVEMESTTANHTSGTQVGLGEGSEFRFFGYQRGGRHVVNECKVSFLEPYAKAFLNGINLVKDRNQFDQRTQMEHKVGGGESMQQFRNILKEFGRANFTGKIIVSKDAQKTNADKLNKNFLLSKDAQANSRPELEIHADDVTCTHGSTTGQPDKEQLFYLQSRGLSKQEAVECLAYGFVEEVLMALPNNKLRKVLKQDMQQHFFDGEEGGSGL